jgi:hypothetical protein
VWVCVFHIIGLGSNIDQRVYALLQHVVALRCSMSVQHVAILRVVQYFGSNLISINPFKRLGIYSKQCDFELLRQIPLKIRIASFAHLRARRVLGVRQMARE